MKRWLWLAVLLGAAACAEDSTQQQPENTAPQEAAAIVSTPQGALAGRLSVKVTDELAERIEEAQQAVTRSGGVPTRSGVADMDLVLESIGTERFVRIFPYEARFEQRHREFGLHRWYTIRFDSDEELTAAAELLSRVEGIETVQYRHRIRSTRKGPMVPAGNRPAVPATRAAMPANDPRLPEQWHYNNTGNILADYGMLKFQSKAGCDVNLFDAWNLCTGSPEIVVAVLDEPVQATHPDLAANMWVNPHAGEDAEFGNDVHGYNFCNNKAEFNWQGNYYDEEYGAWMYADHGTHVAGTIAAVNGNGIDVCGIAGGANGEGGVKIMSCQILDSDGDATNDSDVAAARAFVYAADRGALIAQCSWGYGTGMQTEAQWIGNDRGAEKEAVDYFIKHAGEDDPAAPLSGGLVIFAAGNDGDVVGDQMMWPGAYSPTVAVASMAPDFTPAYYTDYGSWVDITAPGGDYLYGDEGMVLSTILEDPQMQFQDGRTAAVGYMQGTSMACPHVSGVAALGLAYASKLGKRYTLAEFKSLLLSSVHDIDSYMRGTKPFIDVEGELAMLNLTDYRRKMGAGYTDAYLLLLNIQGTPGIYVQCGKETEIPLERYFGGSTGLTLKADAPTAAKNKVGMETLTTRNGKLVVKCTKPGVATVNLTTLIGQTAVSHEIALIVREQTAANGGWL
ncbi:MAG: S8 family serine peptidase [Alistipes sp.]|nr:S8 family serine peptidase [Alistipes sp.]